MPKVPVALATTTPLVPSPPHHLFTNDDELRYFKVFCDNMALNLGEYLDTTLWNRIVLQASEEESFIKHAVISLGALNKTLDRTTGPRDLLELQLTTHHQIAFRYYGQSIQGIRKACGQHRRSKRTILIACLLAICFEYYYGNVDVAIMHIDHGIKLSKYSQKVTFV